MQRVIDSFPRNHGSCSSTQAEEYERVENVAPRHVSRYDTIESALSVTQAYQNGAYLKLYLIILYMTHTAA